MYTCNPPKTHSKLPQPTYNGMKRGLIRKEMLNNGTVVELSYWYPRARAIGGVSLICFFITFYPLKTLVFRVISLFHAFEA
jgi:hypothetical protein